MLVPCPALPTSSPAVLQQRAGTKHGTKPCPERRLHQTAHGQQRRHGHVRDSGTQTPWYQTRDLLPPKAPDPALVLGWLHGKTSPSSFPPPVWGGDSSSARSKQPQQRDLLQLQGPALSWELSGAAAVRIDPKFALQHLRDLHSPRAAAHSSLQRRAQKPGVLGCLGQRPASQRCFSIPSCHPVTGPAQQFLHWERSVLVWLAQQLRSRLPSVPR